MPTRQLLLLLILLPTLAGAAGYRPQPFTARYSVYASGFPVGEIVRTLKVEADGHYVLENTLFTTGFVALFKPDRAVETSTWIYRDDKPLPLSYVAHYTGRAKDVTERLDFDWDHHVVNSLRDGKTTPVPLVPGTLDKLMHQIVLRGDIAAGKKHIEYQVADRGEIKSYAYDVVGDEQVVTARGKVEGIKVQKGTTTFWVAPAWDYLLIKLVQKNSDSSFASYIQAN